MFLDVTGVLVRQAPAFTHNILYNSILKDLKLTYVGLFFTKLFVGDIHIYIYFSLLHERKVSICYYDFA